MSKLVNIAVSLVVSAFIAVNLFLIFSDKSAIEKSVHVSAYERMTLADYNEEIPKEGLIVPSETYTVYVEEEETIESWLVAEGDSVMVGQELALLNTDRANSRREVIEADYDGLLAHKNELESMIAELLVNQSMTNTETYSDVNRSEGLGGTPESPEETKIELDVNFSVDVTQEGSYTEAISSAEQQLADVARQLVVAEAQIAQDPTRPALNSPIDGVVSTITRTGTTLAIEIFDSQKEILTFVKDDEWTEIEMGDPVLLQGEGIDGVVEGTVRFVSTIHAQEDELLTTYKDLDKDHALNPLAYYEVRIQPEVELDAVPFSHNVNTVVITNEVFGAVSVNDKWLRKRKDQTAQGTLISELGRASVVNVETPFSLRKRAVVTNGLYESEVAIKDNNVGEYDYEPRVYLKMPSYLPKKEEWKSYGWKNYVRYGITK